MHNEPTIRLPPPLDRRTALFLDVDGTLLEIAARPDLVRVPPALPALLERLAGERDGALALVSGRPIAELDRLFRPWHGAMAGLHGSERRRADGSIDATPDAAAEEALDQVRPRLAAFAQPLAGVLIEDKGAAIALHYRAAPARGAEIRAFTQSLCIDESPRLRVIHGKMVSELSPRHRDKGAAVSAFLAEPPFRGRLPVYLGDDTTDEDAFAEIGRRGGVAIRVGEGGESAAPYLLPSVPAVLAWLAGGHRSG
jgi:trehalose 6-phosphate phosphatase